MLSLSVWTGSSGAQAGVAAAFDRASASYDADWTDSTVGRAQRAAVRRVLAPLFARGDRVLDLGCGTGADAAWLADRGVEVLGIDASPRMIDAARRRAAELGAARAAFEVGAIEDLARMAPGRPFDGAFSNFAALDCVEDLAPVAAALGSLVRPRGALALVVFGRFCLWETAWHLARGDGARAFRRAGASSARDRAGFAVHYRSRSDLRAAFAPHFRLVRDRGIGVAVPPSYTERWMRRHPILVSTLASIDRLAGACPGARAAADHRLLVFERR